MPTVPIPFGEWLPDQPPIGLSGATVATNVIPNERSYSPFPRLQIFSGSIGSRCRGGIFATDNTPSTFNYVGDSTALYSLQQQSFTVVTRASGAYSLDADEFWEFANWGNTVIAVNGFNDLPQTISLGAAAFTDLSIGVKARHIGIMRDFVVLGNVSDSATNVHRVRWSAINNPTSFTADAATLADYQDLPSDGGWVQKVLGGEYGIIMQERAIWRMQFVGSPLIFQFDPIHKSLGAYVAQAAVRYQNLVFFLSRDGFYSFNGTNLVPIGRGKVDSFFYGDLNFPHRMRIHAAIDPANKLVLWAYPSSDSMGSNPDKLLAYSWGFDRWILVEGLDLDFLLLATSVGGTLDGLDSLYPSLDSMPVTLDAEQWTSGQVILSAFNSAHRLGHFNGSAMAAIVETGEFQLFKDREAMLTEVWPQVVGVSASYTITLMNRNTLTQSLSAGSSATVPNATGFAEFRDTARYFRIRLNTANGVDFTHLVGVNVLGTPSGVR